MFDPRQRTRNTALWIALVLGPGLGLAASPELQFNRDIRPLLSENCLACHGPDPGSRKAGLRLDTRESLFGQTGHEGELGEAAVADDDAGRIIPPVDRHIEAVVEGRVLLLAEMIDLVAHALHV
jgi:hypothetical protein